MPLTEHEAYESGYRERLYHISELCAARNVRLLLLTQPILAPDSSDTRRIMERYNAVTKEVASAHVLPLFDLANELAQDQAYYLDGIHFSNAGAAEVQHRLPVATGIHTALGRAKVFGQAIAGDAGGKGDAKPGQPVQRVGQIGGHVGGQAVQIAWHDASSDHSNSACTGLNSMKFKKMIVELERN